ncbi:MAG: lysophospholipid transporter LplT [Desulfosporosinus sp.]|nr:lysophospholipid transporter LplT [Desulfosporosinus sp.]
MVKPLSNLLIAQFLSALADNAAFFAILVYLAKYSEPNPEIKMAAVQAAFLLAYVLLAPIVGTLADKNSKSNILAIGNIVKGLGIVALLAGVSPIISYGIIGIGAVVYSPAKYGILTELTTNGEELLKANAKIESLTIVAILIGTVAGGAISEFSVYLGISACLVFYVLSLIMSLYIPKKAGNTGISYITSIKSFFSDLKCLVKNPKLRFSLIGTSSFWMTSAVLRIAFLAWLAIYLGIKSQAEQSVIVGVTAIGIMIGAILTPKLINTDRFYNVYKYGFVLASVICLSYFINNLILTVGLLLTIGFLGGIFVVPLNTIIQENGKQLIGSGKTIAVQNFAENCFMLIGIGLYKFAVSNEVAVNLAVVGIGFILLVIVLYLFKASRKLNK